MRDVKQRMVGKLGYLKAEWRVVGTCPDGGCNYDSARGDQCEKCGKLLNPTELKEPRCKTCQNTPRIRDTRHLFLELPLLKDKLVEYINKMSVAGSWSQNAIYTTQAWLTEGLKARSITRDLKWGVPVPHENFKDKVMFLCTLLGSGENWTLMKSISVTEYLNYEAGKFSKSKGVGVFGNDVKDTKIPVEVSDTLFTWDDLQAKLNNELLSKLGNFINRVLSFIAKPPGYDSITPEAPNAESQPLTKALSERVGKHLEQYIEAMEKVKLKQGVRTAMSLSSEGNAYLQLYKEDQPSCSTVMRTAVGLVHILACLLEPFIPSFSIGVIFVWTNILQVFKQLNLSPQAQISLCEEKGDVDRARRPWEIIPPGHKFEIDVGEAQPRTVVTGLVKYIPLEEMQNRLVCVLCSLKPAAMGGIKSHAKVLAASNDDHTKVELVEPPKSATVGERVTFPGFTGELDDVLNPKKKVWETLQVYMRSDADLVACYKDIPLTTTGGVCKVSSISNDSIK
ncbi:putative methionine--tRNA ligase [Hibiscus syriacus]|uniref:Methionyl-tRNA synthetase n=1 Tax=Hibiscus syriacus TaxID=106335 RepID=A0A6A3A1A5_HIBSY|nr:putative methionine--tRNA ligase [Hibiscus syriacus]